MNYPENPPLGSSAISQEQFRQLMIAALEDSPRAREIVRQAFLPAFPVAGGAGCPNGIKSTTDLTTGKLPYCDGSCDVADSNVFYDATNSRIGVGTNSPQQTLHVSGAAPVFLLRSTGTGLRGLWVAVDDTNQVVSLNSSYHDGGAYPITFQMAGSEKVRIASSGNVGIGTAAPGYGLDVKAKSSVGAATFTGPGLNDMTTGGTFLGSAALNYKVQIDGTGTPNTFKWSEDGGANWKATLVPITGTAQTLDKGVTVTFGATTGHTLGNYWTFSTTVTNQLSCQDAAGHRTLTANNDGSLILGSAGATLPKQITGGPEIISFQDDDSERVAFAGFVTGQANFRFGASVRGFMEWGPGTDDQDVALYRFGDGGGLVVQSFNGKKSDRALGVKQPTTDSNEGRDLFWVSTKGGSIAEAKGDVGIKAHVDATTDLWAGSEAHIATAALETNTTALTPIASITLDSPRAYQILVRIVARQADGSNRALFLRTALAYNESGTAAVQNQANLIGPLGGTNWACDFFAPGSDNKVLVRVQTPVTAAHVYWAATIEYQAVGTNS